MDFGTTLAAFGITICIMAFAWRASRRVAPGRRSKGKESMYACGEKLGIADSNVPVESFYASIANAARADRLRDAHNGSLSRYLTWVFAGMVAVMAFLLLLG
ncbi:MAG: hypothetical protein DRO99_02740 [Candidatus Aenigmatarchaeota archaeon]|nr:MAG: hypothetical protein DRO99_02740 [Candidatus Aenigmarchaeota archaeon]